MENFQSLKTIFHDGQIVTTDPTTCVGKTLLKLIKSYNSNIHDKRNSRLEFTFHSR